MTPENNHLTPAQTAEFDQASALINDHLATFMNAHREAQTMGYAHTETLIAIYDILVDRTENKEAACQYLAFAIARLVEISDALETLYQTITHNMPTTDNGSPESNSESPKQ